MKIHSPMATGNGAYIVHRMLESRITGYKVCPYSPWWTLAPPLLYAICRKPGKKIIHTTPDYAIFSASRNLPLVVTFHNYVLDRFMAQYSSPAQRLHYATDLKWFTRKAAGRADILTAVSRFTAGLVARELGISREIRVIYNGIDETRFTPGLAGNLPGKSIKVLFSGNLTSRKGADLLPEIAKRLNPGIELIYTTGLRCRRRLPDHPALQCVGRIAFDAMPELYNSVDMLLFPTVREGFGLAAAEAMACGLPVVATNCSSLPELVEHGKGGFLCTLGDADAFADRINELAESSALRKEMSEYNRTRVEERFRLARMIDDYTGLFEEIAGRL